MGWNFGPVLLRVTRKGSLTRFRGLLKLFLFLDIDYCCFLAMPAMSKVMMLPLLPGVFALSKAEVKKDLREMEREMASPEEDTDSSIKSDDVLSSTYPVRPRKTPRRDRTLLAQSLSSSDTSYDFANVGSGTDIDEMLKYIQMIESTKPELLEIDKLREEKEVQYRSLVDAIGKTTKDFLASKSQEENYFHVLQSLHIRALQLRSVYLQRNLLMADAYNTSTARKEAAAALLAAASASSAEDSSAQVLRITLQPSDRKVIFYRGQIIATPFGQGRLTFIDAPQKKLRIQLSFGTLSSSLSAVVSWHYARPGGVDALSDDFLLHHWKSREGMFNTAPDYNHRLRQLIGVLEDEENGCTDNDEAAEEGNFYSAEDPIDASLTASPRSATEQEASAAVTASASSSVAPSLTSKQAAGAARAQIHYALSRDLADVPTKTLPYLFAPSGN